MWQDHGIQAQRALDYLARANGDLKGLEAQRLWQSLRRCTLALTLKSIWNQKLIYYDLLWFIDLFWWHELNHSNLLVFFGSDSMIRVYICLNTWCIYIYIYIYLYLPLSIFEFRWSGGPVRFRRSWWPCTTPQQSVPSTKVLPLQGGEDQSPDWAGRGRLRKPVPMWIVVERSVKHGEMFISNYYRDNSYLIWLFDITEMDISGELR